MSFQQPNSLSAHEACRQIGQGKLTPRALVDSCIDAIDASEAAVQAWSYVARDAARAEADRFDAAPFHGALAGVPIAVKDVIDVAGMPTGMGSSIYRDFIPGNDASCVALLKSAGAIMLGKTVTAEFAGVAPGPTRNPLDLSRTPGGSSSGSAAAVAANMVPIALGTQTGGSVLRPASYCGVIGFKPSYGLVHRGGMKFAAESFDTIGVIARDIRDVALVSGVLTGGTRLIKPLEKAPRLAVLPHWPWAKSDTSLDRTVTEVRARGGECIELTLPVDVAELRILRATINNFERARALAWEWENHRAEISPLLTRTVEAGWSISFDEYLAAIRKVEDWRRWSDSVVSDFDAILTPATNGEALSGIDYTGEPAFQENWTMLHMPTITLPLEQGPQGLPCGVQLVGRRLCDDQLLQLSAWMLENISSRNPLMS